MTTLQFAKQSISFLSGLMLVACASAQSSPPKETAVETSLKIPTQLNENSKSGKTSPAPARGCDGASNLAQTDRIAILDKLVDEVEAELQKNPDAVKNQGARDRFATFAAGAIDDKTPFVNLDRHCWADFHEARSLLRRGNEAEAKNSAESWMTCLRAEFPDRVDIAAPYAKCFEIGATSKPKSSSKKAKK